MSHFAKKMGPFVGADVAIVVMSLGSTRPSCFIAVASACGMVAAFMLGSSMPPIRSWNERSRIAWN